MQTMPDSETLEGYVVDIICLRKYPVGEYAERAKKHTRACALEGHCVESGFALVGDNGRAALLDPEATVRVVEAVRGSDQEAGIRLRVRREEQQGEMQTVSVEAINPIL
jgi:hypothetical protein